MVKFLKIPFACFLLGDDDTHVVRRMPLNLVMLEQVAADIVISIHSKFLKYLTEIV